jgi:hypothetical protein
MILFEVSLFVDFLLYIQVYTHDKIRTRDIDLIRDLTADTKCGFIFYAHVLIFQ